MVQALSDEDHARVDQGGNRAERHRNPSRYKEHMRYGDRRGNGCKAGEGADMARRGDDSRQQKCADGIAGKVGRHHDADRLTAEAFIAGEHKRSEEHTSELQSLMRISYAVFCLKKKHNTNQTTTKQA